MQNDCMRNILKAERKTCTAAIVEELRLISVNELVMYNAMLFIHKDVRQDAPRYLTSKIVFICDIQARSLENSGEARLTTSTKSNSQKALFYKGVKMYNSRPEAITGESLFCKFKTLLKEQLISGRGNR